MDREGGRGRKKERNREKEKEKESGRRLKMFSCIRFTVDSMVQSAGTAPLDTRKIDGDRRRQRPEHKAQQQCQAAMSNVQPRTIHKRRREDATALKCVKRRDGPQCVHGALFILCNRIITFNGI